MTTILYDGANLHADRRIVSAGYPSKITDNGTKLYRGSNNRIAIAVGNILPGDDKLLDLYMRFSFQLLVARHNGMYCDRGSAKSVGIADYDFPDGKSVNLIAISNTHAVRVCDGDYWPITGDPSYMGTGGRYAFSAYWVTRDPATAMRIAARHDGLSSPEFDSIPANTLSPFVLG